MRHVKTLVSASILWFASHDAIPSPTCSRALAQHKPASKPYRDLTPSNAARALLAEGHVDGSPNGASAELEPKTGQEAADQAYRHLQARGKIQLERLRGGSYVYRGRGVTARISEAGGLVITSNLSKSKFILEPARIDDERWVVMFFRTTFDLYARIELAFGNDSYRSERRLFLEQTEELRMTLLENRYAQMLKAHLCGVWKSARTSVAQKKAQTVEIWQVCAGDSQGARARAWIESFIRQHCPLGSACEYTAAELRTLNATLVGKPFLPYGTERDAGSANEESVPHCP